MDYYVDIRVLPDPEFKATVLVNALYAKCHRLLGQMGGNEVGVSFPNYDKTLGDTLRLHGGKEKLKAMMETDWLQGLRDYTQASEILTVPENAQYRTVQRIQKRSPHNKRSRAIAKGWLTEEEAEQKFPDQGQIELKQPYAYLRSLSNNNPMRVFIQHGELCDVPILGRFSSYGLSKTSTIPWF